MHILLWVKSACWLLATPGTSADSAYASKDETRDANTSVSIKGEPLGFRWCFCRHSWMLRSSWCLHTPFVKRRGWEAPRGSLREYERRHTKCQCSSHLVHRAVVARAELLSRHGDSLLQQRRELVVVVLLLLGGLYAPRGALYSQFLVRRRLVVRTICRICLLSRPLPAVILPALPKVRELRHFAHCAINPAPRPKRLTHALGSSRPERPLRSLGRVWPAD